MDNAVGLVRAYLHLNGYFTVTEFPVVEALDGGGYRTATDLDVLAFRFARAASDPSTHGREGGSGRSRVSRIRSWACRSLRPTC